MTDPYEKACPLCSTAVERIDDRAVPWPHQSTAPGYVTYHISFYKYACPVCGTFLIDTYALQSMAGPHFPPAKNKAAVSAYTRQRHMEGNTAVLCVRYGSNPERQKEFSQCYPEAAYLEDVAAAWPIPVSERVDRTLNNLVKLSEYPGHEISIDAMTDYPLGYCENPNAFTFLLEQLQESKLIFPRINLKAGLMTVLPNGWNRIAELQRGQVGEHPYQAFVAMWFGDDVKLAYIDGIKPGIEDAGYDPRRIDGKEHIGKIDDEIISEIRRSRFVVADFTGHRGGVYYEAGFAAALGLPVVYTCRKDQMKDLHFDIRQYNTIDWETPEDLRDRLAKRITAVIGLPPSKP